MIYLYPFHSYRIRDNSGGIFLVDPPRIGKEWGKEQNGTTRNFAV
ncbi:phosphoglycerate mutase [Clostridium sp. OF09-36]|nr:phosphoglycerate mutase [Clostridium sp. OF09-36]